MRLLNTRTGNFEEFQGNSQIPHYAILSHTWSPEGEQTYQYVRKVQEAYKEDIVKQETSCPISHSAPLVVAEADTPFAPIASVEVTPVSAVEESPRDRGFWEGVSTVGLAWALLTLRLDSSIPLQLSQVADGDGGSYAVVSPPPVLIADIWDPSRGLCEKIRMA